MPRSACRVYIHEANRSTALDSARATPPDWHQDQYAHEVALQTFLKDSPLRTHSLVDADLIFFAANYSGMCWAGRQYYASSLFRKMWTSIPSTGKDVLKVAMLTRVNCPVPWAIGGSFSPKEQTEIERNVLQVRVSVQPKYAAREIVAPSLINSPHWLLGGDVTSASGAAGNERRWDARPLILLIGHIPKLYISVLRFALWRAFRDVPDATIVSSTLGCSVGAYRVCSEVPPTMGTAATNITRGRRQLLRRRSNATHAPPDHVTFCHAACANAGGRTTKFKPLSSKHRCTPSAQALADQCRSYAGYVDFPTEGPLMAAATRVLSRAEYLALAMGHRFCIAAPGDTLDTPKYTEFLLVAAAGGCIPLIVVPDAPTVSLPPLPGSSVGTAGAGSAGAGRSRAWAKPDAALWTMARVMLSTLPHARRIDWCEIGYLLPASLVNDPAHMAEVVKRLRAVGDAEITARRAAARRMRPLFVYDYSNPGGAGATRTGGAEADLVEQLCELARRHRRWSRASASASTTTTAGRSAARPPAVDHSFAPSVSAEIHTRIFRRLQRAGQSCILGRWGNASQQ